MATRPGATSWKRMSVRWTHRPALARSLVAPRGRRERPAVVMSVPPREGRGDGCCPEMGRLQSIRPGKARNGELARPARRGGEGIPSLLRQPLRPPAHLLELALAHQLLPHFLRGPVARRDCRDARHSPSPPAL